MLKHSLLFLALAGALAAPAAASPFAAGTTRLYNFDSAPQDPLVDIAAFRTWGSVSAPLSGILPTGASLVAEVFDGLNLTGASLGSFNLTTALMNMPGAFDGQFSLRVTAVGDDIELGDANGVVQADFHSTQRGSFRFARIDSTVATDARTSGGTAPEPGSLLLVVLAGLALGATRRRGA